MTFTPEQVEQLEAKLDGSRVKERDGFSYLEGWWAIREANRIFGHGEWDTQIVELRAVVNTTQDKPNYKGRDRDGYIIGYIATVKVHVRHGDVVQVHEDVGYGEGINYSNVGQAHESATKEAVTDALKRALHNWGNPFGLSLYDKAQADVERAPVDYGHGICPEHGVPYRQSEKQASAGFAPSHKQGDGWCQKREPPPDVPSGRFNEEPDEGSPEAEAKRLLSERFHGESAPTRAYVKSVLGRDMHPKDMTPIDWGKLYSALVDDELDTADPIAKAEQDATVEEATGHKAQQATLDGDAVDPQPTTGADEIDWETGKVTRR